MLRCAACAQATDEELQRAHTAEHVRRISGPPKADEWLMGDNFYSEVTPIAARYAAGCSVQVLPNSRPASIPVLSIILAARGQSSDAPFQKSLPSISNPGFEGGIAASRMWWTGHTCMNKI